MSANVTSMTEGLHKFLSRMERLYLKVALNQYEGNVSRAAQAAHIGRTTLQRKMRKAGIPIGYGKAVEE